MISRILGISTLICLIVAWSAGGAFAERRIALVIGNSAYKNVVALPNPARDGAAMAAMFRKAGFDAVEERSDLTNIQMRRALRAFARKALHADIAVVYYAGHGIEVNGTNYLIPVDAKLATDLDVEDETISLDRVERTLEPVRQLRLIILDACRENPFAKTMTRSIATRSIGRGLAKVEVNTTNTLVAFAAKAGMTAEDGDGTHSPYTAALLGSLAVPGLDLRLALGRVRDAVLKDTDNKQEPYYYGSIGGATVSLVPAPKAPPVAAVSHPAELSTESLARDYAFAERIGTREAWDTFLAAHKSGFYADLARAARDKLVAEEKHQSPSVSAEKKAAAAEEAKRLAAERARLRAAEQERQKAEVAAKKATEEEARLKAKQTAPPPQKKIVVADAPHEAVEAPKRNAAPDIAARDLVRELQAELRRVGCDPGAVNGKWSEDAIDAMRRFNRRAHAKLEVKVASLDALEAVKQHKARVCPLVCRRGYKAEDDRCVRVACRHGYVRNNDGECERPRRRSAERPAARERAHRGHGGSTGQIYCGPHGCQPVPRGCHIGWRDAVYGDRPGAALICN
jgi:uncharacterized caspase-like protein